MCPIQLEQNSIKVFLFKLSKPNQITLRSKLLVRRSFAMVKAKRALKYTAKNRTHTHTSTIKASFINERCMLTKYLSYLHYSGKGSIQLCVSRPLFHKPMNIYNTTHILAVYGFVQQIYIAWTPEWMAERQRISQHRKWKI